MVNGIRSDRVVVVGSLEDTLRMVVLPPSSVYSIVAPVKGVKPSNPFIQVIVMNSSSYVVLPKSVTGAGGTVVGMNGGKDEGGGRKGKKGVRDRVNRK